MADERVVLDADDMRRTLVRIAHEIVEKNADRGPDEPSGGRRASTAAAPISPRGSTRCSSDLLDAEVPLGDLDISFYRDDLGRARRGAGGPRHAIWTSTSTAARS